MKQYKAKVNFEISVDANGYNYLVIYGQHINGYFCCIPNWNVGCEMAEPSDVFYNRSRLVNDACLGMNVADTIAKAIRDTSNEMCKDVFVAKYEMPGEIERMTTIFAKDLKTAYEEAESLKCDDEQLITVYTDKEFEELYPVPEIKPYKEDDGKCD